MYTDKKFWDEEYVECKEKNTEFQTAIDKWNGKESYILEVEGEGGAGKTCFLQWQYRNLEDVDTVFIEVSACTNELDVLNLLAAEMENRFEKILFEKFHIVYEWFYQKTAKLPCVTPEELEKRKEELSKKESAKLKEALEKGVGAALELIVGETVVQWPFVKAIKLLLEVAKNNHVSEKVTLLENLQKQWRTPYSEIERRKQLRELFLEEYKQWYTERNSEKKVIIFVDNFYEELKKEVDWFDEKSFSDQMHALWIIGARSSVPIKKNDQITIQGLAKKEALDYLSKKSKLKRQSEIIGTILNICRNKGTGYYLPYKLNLATNFYNSLSKSRDSDKIIIEKILELENADDFISAYFYMDVPKYLLNVGQILSCFNVWDEENLQFIQKKFNSYLLHAKYLLGQYVGVEYLPNGKFKLSENIRKALYKNSENIIKYDIQEYVFEEFIKWIDGSTDMQMKDDGIKILQVYGNLLSGYLQFRKDKEEQETKILREKLIGFEKLEGRKGTLSYYYQKFVEGLTKVYRANHQTENVTEEFVSAYENIVEKFGEIFKEENKEIYIPDYIKKRQELAMAYTNLGNPQKSIEIEAKDTEYAWKLMNLIGNNVELKTGYVKAVGLYLACLNSLAYDLGYDGKNDEGLEKGQEALETAADKVRMKFFEQFKRMISSEENNAVDILDKIYQIEEVKIGNETIYRDRYHIYSNEFEKNNNFTYRSYLKVVNAYSTLYRLTKNGGEAGKFASAIWNLLTVEFNKIRGNYPWYCIRMKCFHEFIIPFGIKTYLMRKAQNDAVVRVEKSEEKNSIKQFLTSYHNISVYAYKMKKDLDMVLKLGTEDCFRRMQYVPQITLNQLKQDRWERWEFILDVQKKVMEKEAISDESGEESCIRDILKMLNFPVTERILKNEETVESIQYLGNYYMGYSGNDKQYDYEIAKEKLGQAFLNRVVYCGWSHQKTWDCGIRLAVVLGLMKKYDKANRLADLIIELSENDKKNEGYKKLRQKLVKGVKREEIMQIMEEEV